MTHQIAIQLMYAGFVVASTFLVHGIMIFIGRLMFRKAREANTAYGAFFDTVRLVAWSLWLMLAHCVSIAMWAMLFHYTGMNEPFEEAFYFSFTTYTTLGFGDIVPPVDWRLLTGISSANGLLLFGLSAAVLVDATERLRGKR